MEYTHEKIFEISNYETDFEGKLKLNSLFNFFQELASIHADILGFGYELLHKDNITWILSRIEVDIIEFPDWQQKIILKTTTKGTQGVFAIRDFEILTLDRKHIASARTVWLLINLLNRRPLRPEKQLANIAERFKNNELLEIPQKISLSEIKIQTSVKLFQYTDIDINRHVNNAVYVELSLNCFDVEMFQKFQIQKFQINFNNEAKFGDEVKIFIETVNNTQYKIEAINSLNNKQIFTTEIKWIPKQVILENNFNIILDSIHE